MIPREGSFDHISWDHIHFIWYLVNGEKINLSAYIFNHICEDILKSYKHENKNVPYARLLSDLFYQSRLIENLKATNVIKDLEEYFGNIHHAVVLGHMKIIKKKDVVKPEASIRIRSANTTYIEDFMSSLS